MQHSNDLASDIGDGDWFKIAYKGPIDNYTWEVYDSAEVRNVPPLRSLAETNLA